MFASSHASILQLRNHVFRIGQAVKLRLRNFNKDELGMNAVEAIILLFVAAIVLLVFFTLIWPLIRGSVMEQLNTLFDDRGNAPQQ